MNHEIQTKLDHFLNLNRKIKSYYEAIGLLHWDLATGAPRKGVDTRSETIGMLTTEAFKLSISDEMKELISFLTSQDVFHELQDQEQRLVEDVKQELNRMQSVPPEKIQAFSVLAPRSQVKWESAKESGDFSVFEPFLTQIVDMKREFIDYYGVKDTRYDTLLDMFEPDLTVAKLDDVFSRLKARLVPLQEKITKSVHKPDTSFLDQTFDINKQMEFSRYILKEMGYDFEAGRLDESVHPFATGLNPGDVRITTHYYEKDVASAVFSSLHEGGHALYEQNIDPKLAGTLLAEGTSMGIHESQSRLWENMIGRSLPFWERYYPVLQSYFPEQLKDVSVQSFYEAINKVESSLIRIEADELTYNLHIIIRYEIEKMLFNENLSVSDLPSVWNEKYEQYLGVTPPHNGVGVLQDVHWSSGDFGYFASYSLGNMYAAQIVNTMRKEIPEFENYLREGKLTPIKEWLTEKVYQYGKSRKPSELILAITGEELNPDYLADYLENKYKEIYSL
ncbi:carboxypeptidase M32 [Paenibacillus sp. Marseille-Q4541]|uniref:carboxypeptidase M32 n=1 Tax=Paenibacillus sp. Marseille-Q4541 TaxID=2831522 RepID=UPI001BAB719B|nr:carboxypeptidase M32 [Paenibacillus sp. Marseille-Q4541]